jgi:hypothetical protein
MDKEFGPYGEEREGHHLENRGVGSNNQGSWRKYYEIIRVLWERCVRARLFRFTDNNLCRITVFMVKLSTLYFFYRLILMA